ncbi:MAG: HAD family hydrolase [Candidatus Heimdallarchaeota archaeon]
MIIEMVIWDCDGTLTTVKSAWQWIHEQMGTWDRGKQHLNDFLGGKIEYKEFAIKDAFEWKGLPEVRLMNILKRIPIRDRCGETLLWFQDLGVKQILISSGLSHLVQYISSIFPVFAYEIANELEIGKGEVSGDVKIRVPWGGKGIVGKEICEKFKVEPSKVLAIGDSTSDLELFQLCGYSIAIDAPKEVTVAATWSVNEIGEIPKILETDSA